MLRIDRVGLSTVQDLGRSGWAHLGVPTSGAADRYSHQLANRLLGNSPGAATLETSGGLILTAMAKCVVVVTGADCEALIDDRVVGHCQAHALRINETLRVNRVRSGMRSYVAVAGGIVGQALLGSLAHDTLSKIIPLPLTQGTLLRVGHEHGPITGIDVPITPESGRILHVFAGPHHEGDTNTSRDNSAWEVLLADSWIVDESSDRIGVRLERVRSEHVRLERVSPGGADHGITPSIPLVRGAVQLTPSGQLLVMLADHPTTGGYPVIAVVHADDVDVLAQCVPGSHLRFRRLGDQRSLPA